LSTPCPFRRHGVRAENRCHPHQFINESNPFPISANDCGAVFLYQVLKGVTAKCLLKDAVEQPKVIAHHATPKRRSALSDAKPAMRVCVIVIALVLPSPACADGVRRIVRQPPNSINRNREAVFSDTCHDASERHAFAAPFPHFATTMTFLASSTSFPRTKAFSHGSLPPT
jgi:hypothetical protein